MEAPPLLTVSSLQSNMLADSIIIAKQHTTGMQVACRYAMKGLSGKQSDTFDEFIGKASFCLSKS